jgi:hypothetical protein
MKPSSSSAGAGEFVDAIPGCFDSNGRVTPPPVAAFELVEAIASNIPPMQTLDRQINRPQSLIGRTMFQRFVISI